MSHMLFEGFLLISPVGHVEHSTHVPLHPFVLQSAVLLPDMARVAAVQLALWCVELPKAGSCASRAPYQCAERAGAGSRAPRALRRLLWSSPSPAHVPHVPHVGCAVQLLKPGSRASRAPHQLRGAHRGWLTCLTCPTSVGCCGAPKAGSCAPHAPRQSAAVELPKEGRLTCLTCPVRALPHD